MKVRNFKSNNIVNNDESVVNDCNNNKIKKILFKFSSILVVLTIILFSFTPSVKVQAAELYDVVDGDQTIYDLMMDASSWTEVFGQLVGIFGWRWHDPAGICQDYDVYIYADDLPDDLYEHLRDLFLDKTYSWSLVTPDNEWYENQLGNLKEDMDEYCPGLFSKLADDSVVVDKLDKYQIGGDIMTRLFISNENTALQSLNTADFTWYDIINEEYDWSDLTSTDDLVKLGANSRFNVTSGVGLSDVLLDTDGAFKALLVGAVSSSLSGAIVSVRDATVETDKLLKEPISGESESDEETIYNTVKSISDSVLFPIAGVILAFVFAYQIYEIVCERNNMNDIGAGTFIQLILRMAICLLLIIYAWPLTEAIFDIGRWIVEGAEPIIEQNTTNVAPFLNSLSSLSEDSQGDALTFLIGFEICINEAIDFGQMLLLLMQGLIINIGMFVVSLIIYVIVYVRLVEIWIYCAISPIPLATMSNREWGGIGRNFFRSIAALAFQAFIIMLCLTLFNVLVDGAINGIFESADIIGSMWTVIGYSLILVFCLFKSGSISKSIMNAQ